MDNDGSQQATCLDASFTLQLLQVVGDPGSCRNQDDSFFSLQPFLTLSHTREASAYAGMDLGELPHPKNN